MLDTVYDGGSQPSLENLLKLYRYLAKERSETMATDFKAAS